MKSPAQVPVEPGAYFGMLLGGMIVKDRVDQLAGWHAASIRLRSG
jgi:hypothetical protein